ncbi:CvfB family protein [Alkalihalobacterium chitinilyticum]|uniref:S1-like domain-containing RNA-binding protein n=1 Tax=Alkalihalobacterium chitinilyticum TaxID=2980103 RepID=A0ABT5VJ70_9BACI|nr:S1-like domain-containing RNA-binding protein [Alkalihalobacterium chitinilyticum]MDE5415504.1 S1-like domain-containing RNA-binding protein [Alkalihalobacterium chitinilyticum]
MNKLQAGSIAELRVERQAEFGYFLTDGEQDFLLHTNEMTGEVKEGDTIEVFLYNDKEGRLAATMTIPKVKLGEYDWVEVVDINPRLGVFVNIGIQKDILVSLDDLPAFKSVWPKVGDQLFVTLKIDYKGRLLGQLVTEEVVEEIEKEATFEMDKQQISGRIYRALKVGSFMLSDEGYRCFIHESQRRQEPRLGEHVTGRVIDVKEDGSLNVSLLPLKQESLDEDAEMIYAYLERNGGKMPYTDKSEPGDIRLDFGMSKAAFKRALGRLMKEKKVEQKGDWTFIIKSE